MMQRRLRDMVSVTYILSHFVSCYAVTGKCGVYLWRTVQAMNHRWINNPVLDKDSNSGGRVRIDPRT